MKLNFKSKEKKRETKERTKTSFKSVLKYVIILAVLVGIGVGVKFIFFPTPKSTDAYLNVYSIANNDTYNKLKTSNQEILQLLNGFTVEESETETYNLLKSKFNVTIEVYNALDKVNDICVQTLIFAKNNNVYNKNTDKIKKEVKNLNKTFENTQAYLDTYYSPFYEDTQDKTYSSVKSYALAVHEYNKQVIQSYKTIMQYCLNILPSLNSSYTNTLYIQTKTKLVIEWTNVYAENIDKVVVDSANLNSYKNCSLKLTPENSLQYENLKQTYNKNLNAVNNCNLKELLPKLSTTAFFDYYNKLSENDKANTDLAIEFILNV